MKKHIKSTASLAAEATKAQNHTEPLKAAATPTGIHALSLAAFFDVFVAISAVAWGARDKSQALADGVLLGRFLLIPRAEFTKISVVNLGAGDVAVMCDGLASVKLPSGGALTPDVYNSSLDALARLLTFLSQPPWLLVQVHQLSVMLEMIEHYKLLTVHPSTSPASDLSRGQVPLEETKAVGGRRQKKRHSPPAVAGATATRKDSN